jgi:hypothetical protein
MKNVCYLHRNGFLIFEHRLVSFFENQVEMTVNKRGLFIDPQKQFLEKIRSWRFVIITQNVLIIFF